MHAGAWATALLAAIAFDTLLLFAAATVAERAGITSFPRALEIAVCILGAALLQGAIFARYGGSTTGAEIAVAAGCVVVSAYTDARCGYVFDALTLPTLALVAIFAYASGELAAAAEGAAIAGGALFALHALTRGRGLGLGDVKLACCIGAALGARNGIASLGVAFIAGGLYAAFLLATRRAHRRDEVAFAPYLAAGMATVVIAGHAP